MLQLQPEMEKWQSSGFELIIVSTDPKDDLKAFFKQNPVNATILLDEDGKAFQQYEVEYIPHDYLIDEAGKVVKSFVGWDDKHFQELQNWLDS